MAENEVDPSQAQGATGTEPASTGAAAATTKDGEPFLVVKRRGQEAALTRDKAIELAQKGLDYERKMAEINEEKARFRDYAELDAALKADPRKKEAVRRAFMDPDSVLSPRPSRASSETDRDDDDPQVEERSAPNPKIEELERELNALKQREGQRAQREAVSATERAVGKAIDSYEFLSAREAGKKQVMRLALGYLREDPHLPIDEAVASAVAEHSAVLKEAQTKELERSERSGAHRGIRPDAGSPLVGTTDRPKFSKDRLRGHTHKAALEAARQFIPKAFGG